MIISSAQNQSQSVDKLLSDAKNSLKQFQFDTAFHYFDAAILEAQESNHEELEAHILRLKGRAYILASQDDSALVNLEKAITISRKIENDSILAMAYLNVGYIIKDRGMPDSAMVLYDKALKLYERNYDSIGIAKVHAMLAIHHKYSGDFDLGLKSALISNYIFKQKKIDPSLARSYINLGNIYEKLGEYDTAAACYENAYIIGKRINNPNISSTSLINRAVMYWHKGNSEHESGDILKAIETYKQTKDEFLKAIAFSEEINDLKTLAMLNSNISLVYRDMGMFQESINSAKEAIRISRELNDFTNQMHALNNLGITYKTLKRYQEAETSYLESLDLAKQSKHKESIKKAYANLSTLYELKGDYKMALENNRLAALYQDSLFNEAKQKEIEKHRTNFEILHLKDMNRIKELDKQRIRAERNTSFGVGIAVIVLLIGLLIFFRMRARKNRIIAAQKIKQLEDEKKLMAARSVLVGQEKERERIARELHDGIGVLLSTASIHFSTVEASADDSTKSMLKKANKLLKDAGKEVRDISHNMMPGVLSKFGLMEAIEDLFEEVKEAGNIKVELRMTCGDTRLAENMEIMLYRVIQELLNNTLKHANANLVSLTVSRDNEMIFIDYRDDGIGFDEEQLPHGKSLGVSGIRSRIEYLGGMLEFESGTGKGVHYDITVPLSEKVK